MKSIWCKIGSARQASCWPADVDEEIKKGLRLRDLEQDEVVETSECSMS